MRNPIVVALCLASCSWLNEPTYTYTEQPDSAHIKGSSDSSEKVQGLFGQHAGIELWPVMVDGAKVDYDQYPPSNDVYMPIPLAPGRHTVKAELRAKSVDEIGYVVFNFNAAPGETYTFREQPNWNPSTLGDKLNTVNVWIEDSHGHKSYTLRIKRVLKTHDYIRPIPTE